MFNADKNFADAHSENRLDQILKAHGVVAPARTMTADPLANVPYEFRELVGEEIALDFDESPDPLEKLFSGVRLDAAMGNRPARILEHDLTFGKMVADLQRSDHRDPEPDDALKELVLGKLQTLNNGLRGDEHLEKAAASARESIRGWVERALAKGITARQILDQVHSGGAEPDVISQVEEAVASMAA